MGLVLLLLLTLVHRHEAAPACIHGVWNAARGLCVCNAGFALSDCSLGPLKPLPPVFVTRNATDFLPPPDDHPLFPQDDVLDLTYDPDKATLLVRSNRLGAVRVSNVTASTRGTVRAVPSYHLHFHRRFLGLKSLGLKSSLGVDDTLLRERLAQVWFSPMRLAH
jgi:hypothetical protein